MRLVRDTDLDPLEFCDVCFQRGTTNLCETYKSTFTKIKPIHFSQQAKLDRLLNRLDSRPRLVDRRWTCIIDSSKRKEFLDSLWGINVTVHTLEDHMRILTKFYKPDIRKLGTTELVELSSEDAWEDFNPKSRNWNSLKVIKKNEKFFAKTNLGNILRSTSAQGTSYFRVNTENGSPKLVPMERRAAYNIMYTIAEPSKVNWKTDTANEHGFIEDKELANIPDEISNFLQRLGTKDKRVPEMTIFENTDFELVKTTLSCIKIDLTRSTETLSNLSEKRSDVPIIIEEIEGERLKVLIEIVKAMGGKIESQKDHLTISGNRGSVRVTFSQDDKSTQDGTAIKIAVSALEDPSRVGEILSMIKKRLGLHDMPLESVISQHWPIITDLDLQYVVQSAISWWSSNPILASKIISENNKFSKVKEWHTKIKEGKIRSSLDTVTLGKIIKQKESKL